MPKQPSKPTFWEQLVKMPRLTRLFVAGIFAITTTLALTPFVDEIYLQYFFTPETRILPSFISVGVGVAMYIAGWIYLVGSVDERVEIRTGLKRYIYIGLITVIIVVLWMVSLLLMSL